jgi:hypothetical protein
MRKCPNCRSLLLGDVESCPRCGAPVPVAVGVAPAATAPVAAPASPTWPPAPAAGSVAASAPEDGGSRVPSYGRLSIPPPVAPAPPGYAPASAPAAPLPAYEQWQATAATSPVKTSISHNPWARVALAVVVALVVGAAVMHLRSDPLPAGTSDFVAGKGVSYVSPDGAFSVLLPQQPQVAHETIALNGVNVPIYIGLVQSDSYVIGVESIISPVPFGSHVNDDLQELASHGVKSAHGFAVRTVATMHGAQPAIEAHFKANGHVGHMLVVATDSSMILLFVYAKTGTDRLFKAVDQSLVIG